MLIYDETRRQRVQALTIAAGANCTMAVDAAHQRVILVNTSDSKFVSSNGDGSGTVTVFDPASFVPSSPTLAPAPGYLVPPYFWSYLTDPRTAPGGWLRAVGLPLTNATAATVRKGTLGTRSIMMQAFQDAVLTYDPRNAAPFRVERANIGADYARLFPQAVR